MLQAKELRERFAPTMRPRLFFTTETGEAESVRKNRAGTCADSLQTVRALCGQFIDPPILFSFELYRS